VEGHAREAKEARGGGGPLRGSLSGTHSQARPLRGGSFHPSPSHAEPVGIESGRRSSVRACPKPEKRGRKPPKRIARTIRVRARSARRGTVEKLDREWSAKVREGVGYCEWTGCFREPTDAHHIFGKKAHPSLRYEMGNGIALCRPCHIRWHATPVARRAWFAAKFPATWAALQILLNDEKGN
jgi:hypothetical protein